MKQTEMTNGRSTILVANNKILRMKSIGWYEVETTDSHSEPPVDEEVKPEEPAE